MGIHGDNNVGATSALKGFRAQFLYSLYRILTHKPEETSFHPEGKFEDLDVYNENGQVIEVIQVKNLSRKLTLSDILAKDENSFVRRAIKVHEQGNSPIIKLVSFGEVNEDITELITSTYSEVFKQRLKKMGLTTGQVSVLEKYFSCECIVVEAIESKVMDAIDAIKIYADAKVSLDLLLFWIYHSAELRHALDCKSLHQKLMAIGDFQSRRVGFHNVFGTLVRPFTSLTMDVDKGRSQLDFYKGIGGNYQHILAGADVIRPNRLASLNQKFKGSNIVFVHGASGQGKSTLAYRYLHDYCDVNTIYQLLIPSDVVGIQELINSLEGISKGIEFPITLFIDVAPGGQDWITILQSLSNRVNLNFLVTIRQEDWNSVYLADKFDFAELELSLDEFEALAIYDSLNKVTTDIQFTDFKNAWEIFGGSGPLLEFVFLITQGESLPAKLKSQIHPILADSSDLAKNKIKLLRFVSLADCFDSKLLYRDIAHYLNFENIAHVTALLEKEYLLKVTDGSSRIVGLHPVRSEILRELLFDSETELISEFALESLHFIDPDSVTQFLRNSFRYAKVDVHVLLKRLTTVAAKSWVFYNGVLKALLWKGVQDFVDKNIDVLDEVYKSHGRSWFAIVNVDISGAVNSTALTALASVSDEHLEVAKEINSRIKGKDDIFVICRSWMTSLTQLPTDLVKEDDFNSFANFLFWLDHFQIDNINIPATIEQIINGFEKHPLPIIARTLYGFKKNKGLAHYIQPSEKVFLDRLYQNHNVIELKDTKDEILCFYFFDMLSEKTTTTGDNFIHSYSIEILNLLRFAYPDKKMFSTNGYGHRFSILADSHDDSIKRIPRENLPLDQLVAINSLFYNLFEYKNRLDGWAEYVDAVTKRRVLLVDVLIKSIDAHTEYHKKKNITPIIEFLTSYANLYRYQLERISIPPLPKAILDEWGYSGEGSSSNATESEARQNGIKLVKALSFRQYAEYRKTAQEFDDAITNYLWQSSIAMTREIRKRANQNTDDLLDYSRISLVGNLFKAYETVDDFHKLFKNHFTKFVRGNTLAELERRELTSISALCFIYRHFIYSGKFLPGNLQKLALEHIDQSYSSFSNKITSGFNSLGKKINSRILIDWHIVGGCITILVYNDSLLNTVGYLRDIYDLLQTIINRPDETSVKWAVLTKNFKSAFVIPVTQGKSILGKGYQMKLYNLIDKPFEDLAPFNLVPVSIRQEVMIKHNIQLWSIYLEEISKLDRLLSCVSTVNQLAFHFAQFHEFNGMDIGARGEFQLGKYLKTVVDKFQEYLQEALDLYVFFVEKCNNGEYIFANDSDKFQLFDLMVTNHKNFYPNDDLYEKRDFVNEISTNEMDQWIPRLHSLTNNTGLIYLILADRILANHLVSTS